jgi:superoxide dismutase
MEFARSERAIMMSTAPGARSEVRSSTSDAQIPQHDKHHQACVSAANNLDKGTERENKPVEEIVEGKFGKNQTLFNNAAQQLQSQPFLEVDEGRRWRRQAVR